jgi:hypothetical protein
VEFEEREVMFAEGRRRSAAAAGRRGAAAARRASDAARVAGVAASRRAVGGAEEYMDNPRRRNPSLRKMVKSKKRPDVVSMHVAEREDGHRVVIVFGSPTRAMDAESSLFMYTDWDRDHNEIESSHGMSLAKAKSLAKAVAQDLGFPVANIGTHSLRKPRAKSAGLKKGQGLMQKAAAAYRAGKYPTMQAAIRGVARTSNPLLPIVPKPVPPPPPVQMRNPKRGGKRGGRTAAQSDAALAMSLFRSGRADSLGEAWAMVKRRA